MEEWERRKEEGELGSEQEQEEENIYAVSKDQEVCISVRSHWSGGNYQISVHEGRTNPLQTAIFDGVK